MEHFSAASLTALVAAAVLAVSYRPVLAASCAPCGDVNCDGLVDAVDGLLIAQMAVGKGSALSWAAAADASDDGVVDMQDALTIAQYAVGLSGPFACAPVLSGLTPSTVDSSGGAEVEAVGSNFQPGATVALGGSPLATDYVDCQTLTFTIPSGRPGEIPVNVRNPDQRTTHEAVSLDIAGAFRDVSAAANLQFVPQRGTDLLPTAGGVALGDVDGDGELDIFVPNHAGPNALFHNRGDGTFQDIATAA